MGIWIGINWCELANAAAAELYIEIDAAWLIGDGKRSRVVRDLEQTLVINGGEKDQTATLALL